MAVIVLEGDERAAMYCNTSMRAFGPVVRGPDAADLLRGFLRDFGPDPRTLRIDELEAEVDAYVHIQRSEEL